MDGKKSECSRKHLMVMNLSQTHNVSQFLAIRQQTQCVCFHSCFD